MKFNTSPFVSRAKRMFSALLSVVLLATIALTDIQESPKVYASVAPTSVTITNNTLDIIGGAVGSTDAGSTVTFTISCNKDFTSISNVGTPTTSQTTIFPTNTFTGEWNPTPPGFNSFEFHLPFSDTIPGGVSCSGSFTSPNFGVTNYNPSGTISDGAPTITLTDPTQEGHDNNGGGAQIAPAFRASCMAPGGQTVTSFGASLNGGGGAVANDGGFPAGLNTVNATLEYSVTSTAPLGQPTGAGEAFPATKVRLTCMTSGGGTLVLDEDFEFTNNLHTVQSQPADIPHVNVGTIGNVDTFTILDDDVNNSVGITFNSVSPIGYLSETGNDTPTIAFGTSTVTFSVPAFYTGPILIDYNTISEFEGTTNRIITVNITDNAPQFTISNCNISGIPCENAKASILPQGATLTANLTSTDPDGIDQVAGFYVITAPNTSGLTFATTGALDAGGINPNGSTTVITAAVDVSTFETSTHTFTFNSNLTGPMGDSATGDGTFTLDVGASSGGFGFRFRSPNPPPAEDFVNFSDQEPGTFYGSAELTEEEIERVDTSANIDYKPRNELEEKLLELMSFNAQHLVKEGSEGTCKEYYLFAQDSDPSQDPRAPGLFEEDDYSESIIPGRITGEQVLGEETKREDECDEEDTYTPEQIAALSPFLSMIYVSGGGPTMSLPGMQAILQEVYAILIHGVNNQNENNDSSAPTVLVNPREFDPEQPYLTPPVYGGEPNVSLDAANAAAEIAFNNSFDTPKKVMIIDKVDPNKPREYTSESSTEHGTTSTQGELRGSAAIIQNECKTKNDCVRCDSNNIRNKQVGVCESDKCVYNEKPIICPAKSIVTKIKKDKNGGREIVEEREVVHVCMEAGSRRSLSYHEKAIIESWGESRKYESDTILVRSTDCYPLEQAVNTPGFKEKIENTIEKYLKDLDTDQIPGVPRTSYAYQKKINELLGTDGFTSKENGGQSEEEVLVRRLVQEATLKHLTLPSESITELISDLLGDEEKGYPTFDKLKGKSVKELIKELILQLYTKDGKLKMEDENDILSNLINNLLGYAIKDDNGNIKDVQIINDERYPVGSFISKYSDGDKKTLADAIVEMMKDCINKIFSSYIRPIATAAIEDKEKLESGTQAEKDKAANAVYDATVKELQENHDLDKKELDEYKEFLVSLIQEITGTIPATTYEERKEQSETYTPSTEKSGILEMTAKLQDESGSFYGLVSSSEINNDDVIKIITKVSISKESGENSEASLSVKIPTNMSIYFSKIQDAGDTDEQKKHIDNYNSATLESATAKDSENKDLAGVSIDLNENNIVFSNLSAGTHVLSFNVLASIYSDTDLGGQSKFEAKLIAESKGGNKEAEVSVTHTKGITGSPCTTSSQCVSGCFDGNYEVRLCSEETQTCVVRKREYCASKCKEAPADLCSRTGNEYFDKNGAEEYDENGNRIGDFTREVNA